MSEPTRRKVLLVIDNLTSGGAQNQLSLLAKGLYHLGYQVEVFMYYEDLFYGWRLEDIGIKMHIHPKREKLGISVIWALKRLYEKEKYDRVISFLTTPNFYVTLAKRLSKYRPHITISYRSMTKFDQLGKMRLKLLEWVNKTADHIVANSVHERRRWQERYPFSAHKWSTIYNGVLPYNLAEKDPGMEIGPMDLLVVASVGPLKNGLVVIEALAQLKAQGIECHVTWIGQRMPKIAERKAYAEQMDTLIKQRGLEDNWTWRPPTHNIYSYYKNCSALLLASTTEGLPNVVCEAMYHGAICIVSEVLDHPLIIKNGYSGYLFDPERPESLAARIMELRSLSEDERNQMGAHAKSFAQQNFDVDTMVASYRQLIDAV